MKKTPEISGSRVVLVTGGTRGIGAAIAEEFWKQGAHVIITGTHQAEVEVLNREGCMRKQYVHADFLDPLSLKNLIEYMSRLDRLDVCVNNAGINIIKPVEQVTTDDFDRITTVNYRAPYLLSQAAAKVMRPQCRGWIVNIASIWSLVAKRGRTLYSAAKSGLAGMTRALATDLASDGILVNCVSPGFVLTDLTRQSLSPSEIQELAQQVPLGRFADPAEIARLLVFLGSEQNTYITGQNIVIDGGFTNV
jgi:3-oxoacyl-[acyl-carrier protein] reductase